MILLLSNHGGIEFGLMVSKNQGRIGHLYGPGGQRGPWPEIPYALDNGAWPAHKNKREWSEADWRALLWWSLLSGQKPLWAVVPDVVGDREQTIDRWGQYSAIVIGHGFRPAFAVQDGMTFDDVPSNDCMLFLGGSTEWKEKAIEPWCKAYPERVHVARVNTWPRLLKCWNSGAASIDGTGWFHDAQRKDLLRFLRETAESANARTEARLEGVR